MRWTTTVVDGAAEHWVKETEVIIRTPAIIAEGRIALLLESWGLILVIRFMRKVQVKVQVEIERSIEDYQHSTIKTQPFLLF
jgi:hypothetical protein